MPHPLSRSMSKSTENLLVQDLFIEIKKDEGKKFKVDNLNDTYSYAESCDSDNEDSIEQSSSYLKRGKTYMLSVSTENLFDLYDSVKTDDKAIDDVNRHCSNRSFKRIERSFDDDEINEDVFEETIEQRNEGDNGGTKNDGDIEDDYLIVDFMDGDYDDRERHISGITTLVFYHRSIPKPVVSTSNVRVRCRQRLVSSSVETTGFSTHGTTMLVFPRRCPRMYLHVTDQWYYSCPCFLHFSAKELMAESLRRRLQQLGGKAEIQEDPEDKMVIHVVRDESRENLLDLDYSGHGGAQNGPGDSQYEITFYDEEEQQEVSKLNLSSDFTVSYEDKLKLKEIVVDIDIDNDNENENNYQKIQDFFDQEEPTLWPVNDNRLSSTPIKDISNINEGQNGEHHISPHLSEEIKVTNGEVNNNKKEKKGTFSSFFQKAKQFLS